MTLIKNKTLFTNKETAEKKYFLLDASTTSLGRLATLASNLLRDKQNPASINLLQKTNYVIIINAEKAYLTGKKYKNKLYKHHSGRPGGLKTKTFEQLLQKSPTKIIEKAIKGMLPKNSTGRKIFRYLKVYIGHTHNYNNKNIHFIKV